MSFRINDAKVAHQTIDGEVVIINLDSGNYYSLDKVGADIWNAIEESVCVDQIVERIACRCGGDRAVVEVAVMRLIAELQQEDLIASGQAKTPEGIMKRDPQFDSEAGAGRLSFEAPVLQKYSDMQDLLLLDPIHEVDETGWPHATPQSMQD
jgi:hypothetical protein